MKILSTLIFISLSIFANGQINDDNIRQTVLKKNIINKLFKFGKWSEESTETHLRYLGKIKTKEGRILKIMNSTWFWGTSSRRATSRILIFNGINQYIGNYALTIIDELPDKLTNGRLIFVNNENDDCDRKLKTIVSFNRGLPKEIFIKCKGKWGNSYTLDTEN